MGRTEVVLQTMELIQHIVVLPPHTLLRLYTDSTIDGILYSIFKYVLQFSTNICTYVTNSPYWYELLLKPFD